MAIVTLSEMKQHLGVTDSGDDTMITAKIDAAQAQLETLLGYEIEEQFETVPADLKEGVRQLAAHLFENREATVVGISAAELPFSVWQIVTERRSYSYE